MFHLFDKHNSDRFFEHFKQWFWPKVTGDSPFIVGLVIAATMLDYAIQMRPTTANDHRWLNF
jgi:hypothetical protein